MVQEGRVNGLGLALAGFPSPTSNRTEDLGARGPLWLESLFHRTDFTSLRSSLGEAPESCRES